MEAQIIDLKQWKAAHPPAMVYYNPSASDISKRLSARPALHQ